jgi:hypothetical protein
MTQLLYYYLSFLYDWYKKYQTLVFFVPRMVVEIPRSGILLVEYSGVGFYDARDETWHGITIKIIEGDA